ncbi:MAG: glycosyltransferase family 2 protein [Patescibacteria group bacterium]
MYKVFVVILNWNGIKDTIECLKSVRRLQITNYKLQIIVVDNGSTDNSVEVLKKQKGTTLLENKENLGFAGGNNVGMKYAVEHDADFILVLNNDTVVEENLIVHLVEAAELDKKAGIFSPKIYFEKGFEHHKDQYVESEKGKVIWYVGGVMDWKNILGSNYGVDDVDVGQYQESREIDFATGACMFIRRGVIEEVGFFDEKYFLYLEDADYSIHAKEAGWKVVFVPKAALWHKVSQSSGIGSELNDYYISRNRMLFGLKHAPIRSKLALIRESLKILLNGRIWQKQGVKDFYSGIFGKGSYPSTPSASLRINSLRTSK